MRQIRAIAKLFAGSAWVAGAAAAQPVGSFTATGNMSIPRGGHTATLLLNGKVLIAGGYQVVNSSSVTAELYDPSTGTFTSTGGMSTARALYTATLLAYGRVLIGTVLVAGGYTFWPSSTAGTELYHPLALVPTSVLFSLSGDGRGHGAIWHADTGQIASVENPAVAGQILAMYTTGLVERAVIPPQVATGGKMAEVLYFGNAPGYPGVNQINLRVPGGVAPGSAVSVRLNYLARPSNEVTIAVQ